MTGGPIKARPFDFPYDGKLDPARLALLAIDLQIDFVSADGYLARRGYDVTPVRNILPRVRSLMDAVRRVGGLVVHTRQGYRADLADMTPYERWRRKRGGLEGTRVLVRGSPGFEIVPELPVAPEDVIVDKTANGAFTYTDLEQILRVRGIEHLLFSGCTTDVCVHTSLRGGARPELPVPPQRGRLRERRRLCARRRRPHGDGRGRRLRRGRDRGGRDRGSTMSQMKQQAAQP
jgi:biuret amidohydrolase